MAHLNGDSQVRSGSGDVRFHHTDGSLVVSTGSGDLVVESAEAGRITARTAIGGVRVGVAAGTPVWTDISAVSGRLHSDVPRTCTRAETRPQGQDRIATPRRQ